ncbi:uncharacterized protein M421DRAFT_89073 [Didymella exigua CBS 183.55]|uniref:Uncharacterized protein n=1 Tax=Didymella exigua CBS 183.55 TaxID=1150837 RepID=A0A6A5RZF0_9PLEO|nr:uncharacterized protein M421DRAFT_89073 [Didymella exigua CBS 183.55]KAF1932710.1 hypothetical protein M421DRAFT_89073 [Didymella exigua CBS 183.55]
MLQQKGAQVSWRTMHKAVLGAAAVGADLAIAYDGSTSSGLRHSIEVLRCIVEDCKADVNALDDNDESLMDSFRHWGSPLCFGTSQHQGASVVQWWLEKMQDATLDYNFGLFLHKKQLRKGEIVAQHCTLCDRCMTHAHTLPLPLLTTKPSQRPESISCERYIMSTLISRRYTITTLA